MAYDSHGHKLPWGGYKTYPTSTTVLARRPKKEPRARQNRWKGWLEVAPHVTRSKSETAEEEERKRALKDYREQREAL